MAKPSQQQLSSLDFDCELFFSHLTTKYLGRSLLIGPVMTSSQTLFTGNINLTECISNELGVVCTPGQQTKGKGQLFFTISTNVYFYIINIFYLM